MSWSIVSLHNIITYLFLSIPVGFYQTSYINSKQPIFSSSQQKQHTELILAYKWRFLSAALYWNHKNELITLDLWDQEP